MSFYGFFEKPHSHLSVKLPMQMRFIDCLGFLYRYHPGQEKPWHCYASTPFSGEPQGKNPHEITTD